MEINELRQRSEAELRTLAQELRTKIQEMRFRTATARLKTVRDVRNSKRDLARVLTVQHAMKNTNKTV